VHRVAGGAHPGGKRKVARLGIGELRLEIPEAVIARVGVDPDRTRVHVATVGHLRQKERAARRLNKARPSKAI
jgi:hypothetical protein